MTRLPWLNFFSLVLRYRALHQKNRLGRVQPADHCIDSFPSCLGFYWSKDLCWLRPQTRANTLMNKFWCEISSQLLFIRSAFYLWNSSYAMSRQFNILSHQHYSFNDLAYSASYQRLSVSPIRSNHAFLAFFRSGHQRFYVSWSFRRGVIFSSNTYTAEPSD